MFLGPPRIVAGPSRPVAAMDASGERTAYEVDVPGGRLRVTWDDAGEVTLTGPAVLVADGEYLGDTGR